MQKWEYMTVHRNPSFPGSVSHVNEEAAGEYTLSGDWSGFYDFLHKAGQAG